jgi:hypothetical protein
MKHPTVVALFQPKARKAVKTKLHRVRGSTGNTEGQYGFYLAARVVPIAVVLIFYSF